MNTIRAKLRRSSITTHLSNGLDIYKNSLIVERMMTINQLKMHNIAPRGIAATCVPTSICFATGVSYYDVEEVLVREQPKCYRPDHVTNSGVNTLKLFGASRKIWGHHFVNLFINRDISVFSFTRKYLHGTFLVTRRGHMFVVKDGEVFDLNTIQFSATVVEAWEVSPLC